MINNQSTVTKLPFDCAVKKKSDYSNVNSFYIYLGISLNHYMES